MNESKKLSKLIWDFIKQVESDYGKYMSADDCDLLSDKIIQAAGPRDVSDEEINDYADGWSEVVEVDKTTKGRRNDIWSAFHGFKEGAKWMRDKLVQPQSNKVDV